MTNYTPPLLKGQSVTRQVLRAVELPGTRDGIFNSHDVMTVAKEAGLLPVSVCFSPQETGRSYRAANWRVYCLGMKTDPTAHWTDYGNKTFGISRRNSQEEARQDALAWATEKFGVQEWDTIPGLRQKYFPKDVAALVKTEIKRVRREAKKAGLL